MKDKLILLALAALLTSCTIAEGYMKDGAYGSRSFSYEKQLKDTIINQGEVFYQEGKKGNATGNHCHIECGKGKYEGTGWFKNKAGYWSILNHKKPEECLWIDDSITILDNHHYTFKKLTSPEKKESTETVEKVFIAPKTDLYGVYLKQNQKIIINKLS